MVKQFVYAIQKFLIEWISDLKKVIYKKNLNLGTPKDFINNQDRKYYMKCCLIYEILGCVYSNLVLEVGLRDIDESFHISYLYKENFLGHQCGPKKWMSR